MLVARKPGVREEESQGTWPRTSLGVGAGRGRSHMTILWIVIFITRAIESHWDVLSKMMMKANM